MAYVHSNILVKRDRVEASILQYKGVYMHVQRIEHCRQITESLGTYTPEDIDHRTGG